MSNPKDMNTILTMDPMKLVGWLYETYFEPLPLPQSSVEFAQYNSLLGKLGNSYAFLSCTYAAASVMVRNAKRNKLSKDQIDEMVSRRDVIEAFMDALKMQYNAFSRMVSVQQNANEEMRMLSES